MLTIDRHYQIFDPRKIAGTVDVIGCGATGSATLLELAKLNVSPLRVWDDDIVVAHNLSNQVLFGPEDVGVPKVHAAEISVETLTGWNIIPMQRRVTKDTGKLDSAIVVLCVDSMAARREVVEHCVLHNLHARLLVDIRITAVDVMVYAFDPRNSRHLDKYFSRWYTDVEVPPDAPNCTVTQSIGATAHIAAGLATWQIINFSNGRLATNELIFNLDHFYLHASSF